MNRQGEQELLDFCAAQRIDFSADQWKTFSAVTRQELAAAALFLAGTEWYGHRKELIEIGEHLAPGYYGRLSVLIDETRFDLSRFNTRIKRDLGHPSSRPLQT
jgi:hypothetical protein